MSPQGETRSYSNILSQVPAEWSDSPLLRRSIAETQRGRNKKIIVLDDDPTGVQTMHDIYVLTDWSMELLREAFERPDPLFYILTNTRAYQPGVAERINRTIAQSVDEISRVTGIEYVFISRSDSTLRGYYPLEIDALSNEIFRLTERTFDGHLIIPAFFEGCRITFGNTHFIRESDSLVPVNETEFSNDKVFGYTHGDLTRWVEEKTHGKVKATDCICISVNDIRQGPDAVEKILLCASGNVPVIVNCLSYADLDVLSSALLHVEEKGMKFIYRTAASFVKSYGGVESIDSLPWYRLVTNFHQHGGLIIVGSHVQKTTRQLENLIRDTNVVTLEMNVNRILNSDERLHELNQLTTEVNRRLSQGDNVVVFSSRKLVAVDNEIDNLNISQTVSASLVHIVQSLQVTPKFIIAKGGITSSDVATKGLGIRVARVIGQATAGVPVWLTGPEAKFTGIPYIVFPGNVGAESTLSEVVQKIEGPHS